MLDILARVSRKIWNFLEYFYPSSKILLANENIPLSNNPESTSASPLSEIILAGWKRRGGMHVWFEKFVECPPRFPKFSLPVYIRPRCIATESFKHRPFEPSKNILLRNIGDRNSQRRLESTELENIFRIEVKLKFRKGRKHTPDRKVHNFSSYGDSCIESRGNVCFRYYSGIHFRKCEVTCWCCAILSGYKNSCVNI